MNTYTTYHLKSADEISRDLLEAIKTLYKSKLITIIVQEDEVNEELSEDVKGLPDQRLGEDQETYISAKSSRDQLILSILV